MEVTVQSSGVIEKGRGEFWHSKMPAQPAGGGGQPGIFSYMSDVRVETRKDGRKGLIVRGCTRPRTARTVKVPGITYVAVPCRNQRLFHRAFWLHHCLRNAVSLNFVKGRAHMRFVHSLDIHASMKRVWAPPLTKVQQYSTSNTAIRSNYVAE